MGKSKKPKQEVTEYYMSEHFGICSGPIDALLNVIIKEKEAWSGAQSALGSFSINLPELFGGVKKEGGVAGTVHYLPGASDQVLPDTLAQKLGRADGADCPGFRGITSLFFTGGTASKLGSRAGHNGFYWTANSPYLPGVWARVLRAPIGLDADIALVPRGLAGSVSMYFLLDRSMSLSAGQFAAIKSAANAGLDLLEAHLEANPSVRIDIGVRFYSSGSTAIERTSCDAADFDDIRSFIAAATQVTGGDVESAMEFIETWFTSTVGVSLDKRAVVFVTDTETEDNMTAAAAGPAADMLDRNTGIFNTSDGTSVDMYAINYVSTNTTWTSLLDNTPADGVPIISSSDESGLTQAVERALRSNEFDANPAHIIYECLTNTDWGMGSPTAAIDTQTFEDAAITLYGESFGLSMLWTRQASIQDFVQEVLDHIQAVLFVDPSTGLLTLKLIRDDYDEGTLDILTPDNADLTSFSRKLWGDIVNEITVTWTNPENEQDETITVQDDGSIATQGGAVTDSRNYYGVRNAQLAMDLAMRDLRSAGQPLATCEAEVDRSQWLMRPASVVKVTWPEYGLTELVMRATSVDYGKTGDPTIKLSLIEDTYGLDVGSYDAPPSTEWVDPSAPPTPLEDVVIFTLPLFMAADTTVADFVDSPEYPEVLAGVLATDDSDDTFSYDLWDEVTLANGSLEWQSLGTNNIIGRGELVDALALEASSTGVTFDNITGQTSPTVAGFVIIGEAGETGNEIAMVEAVGDDYTLTRGVLDTVPRAWPAGTLCWFVDGETLFEDPTVRSAGETVDYKLLTRTSLGVLALEDASLESYTLTERPWLPNRPADVEAYGEAWSSLSAPTDARDRPDPWVTVTWANRNRLTEDSQVLGWTDSTVTPETGQTTTIEVRATDGTLLTTHDGLAGTSYDVPDASFGSEIVVELRVYSERTDDDGDFVSLQYFSHWVQVGNATFDSTVVTFDSTAYTMDQG